MENKDSEYSQFKIFSCEVEKRYKTAIPNKRGTKGRC